MVWFLCEQTKSGFSEAEPQVWHTVLYPDPFYNVIISPTGLIYVFNFSFQGAIWLITWELQNLISEIFASIICGTLSIIMYI